MCGIVGYVGEQNANDVIIAGLKKLEYRGYDSCGIVTMLDNKFNVVKSTNRIDDLEEQIKKSKSSKIGLGHTRWATHGGATTENAHPHTSSNKRCVVVHNGIIENYSTLKDMLKHKGYKFYSDTDTEVVPNLIDLYYDGDLLKAVKKATDMLEGSFALGIMDVNEPSTIIATKRNSPLVIGVGDKECFMASDFSAILKYTNRICVLENDEFTILKNGGVSFFNKDLKPCGKDFKFMNIKNEDTEKNGYEHFMLKEINENTLTVKKTVKEYLKDDEVVFDLKLTKEDFEKVKQIHIVACGTAMHAGLNGKNIIEKLTRIPVNVDVASEFRYRDPILHQDDLVIFISQSGETADTVACIELVKEKKIKFISIVNVEESTIDRMSENVIYTKAGPEIAVASTKAYIAQVCVIDLFAIYLAKLLKTGEKKVIKELISEMKKMHIKVQQVLDNNEKYEMYANELVYSKDVFYLGRGLDYYTSLEGSLKLKEISYIHSEAAQFGELKHGPIALIEKDTPAIALCTSKKLLNKVVSNVKEIKARGAKVLFITNQKLSYDEIYDDVIEIPHTNELLSAILAIIPLQLIAYYTTVLKGLDVDKPRNLAKSVTVE